MRLFVALSLPTAVRENLSSLLAGLQRADGKPKWVNPQNLHVTLKFIGELASEKLPGVNDALASIRSTHPVNLEFRGTGFFPNERRPGVAWVGIHASPNLASLAAEMNSVLAPLGIPREEKPFVPHLTVARFKETRPSPALLAEMEKFQSHSFGILCTREFHIVESKLKPSGAEYTAQRSFRFAPEPPESREW
jgi:2'-5' RNA ligase